jgi:hypothetical protein
MISNNADNLIHFLNSSVKSANLICSKNSTLMDDNGQDLLDDFKLESMLRNRCNTWPMRYPTEFQANDSFWMHGNM